MYVVTENIILWKAYLLISKIDRGIVWKRVSEFEKERERENKDERERVGIGSWPDHELELVLGIIGECDALIHRHKAVQRLTLGLLCIGLHTVTDIWKNKQEIGAWYFLFLSQQKTPTHIDDIDIIAF